MSTEVLDLAYAGVAELGAAYRRGTVSPPEVVRAQLSRIEGLDQRLRAFITVTGERALAEATEAAKELRSGVDRGPLHGIPYAIKDQVATRGLRTSAGSRLFEHWIPSADATVVTRLRDAGAILLGKLNMMELGLGRPRHYTFGVPRNPWNPRRETGGSSSGSGSALAAGMATVTIGEDTGGSIRHPAAHCGVVGLRPSWGRVSRWGLLPAVWSMDTLGPMARSVADVAATLQAIAGPDPMDQTTLADPPPDFAGALSENLAGLRLAVVTELLPGPEQGPEAAAAVEEAVKVFRRLGVSVGHVSVPLVRHAGVIATSLGEPLAALQHLSALRRQPERFDPTIRIRLARGLAVPGTVVLWAEQVGIPALRRQLADALAAYDLLIAPTTATAAPPIEEGLPPPTAEDVAREFALQSYRMPLSFTGGPVLAVPCGFTRDGLPLSMQLAAAAGREALVLRAGHQYQQATAWHHRRPPLE